MLHLLALIVGCAPQTQSVPVDTVAEPAADAFAAPVDLEPVGRAKVNRGCFSQREEEAVVSSRGYGSGGGYGAAPSANVAVTAPTAAPAKPAPHAPPAERADKRAEAGPADRGAAMDSLMAEESDDRRRDAPRPAGPAYDWGGVTWLSNDDSMSLASAQRILWALQHRQPVDPREVRPHEVLNYFSFDTVTPEGRDLFGVRGSAVKIDADSMSVALSVKGALPPRQPLDLTLVVDRSGSMSAEGRMEYVKEGLRVLSDRLQAGDRVDVVLFDHEVCTALEDYVVGRDDKGVLTQTIDQLQPRGSTNIGIGLHEGYRIATNRGGGAARNRRVVLLTDALVNQGDVNADTLSEIGRALDVHGVRLSGVGVGSDFNDEVLDKLTEKGKGAYVFLGSPAVVKRVFGVGFDSLVSTIAHDVRFSLDLPPSLAVERFYGEESSTVKEDVQPIHYFAGTSQLFLQDLIVDPSKLSPSDPLVLTIEYQDAATGAPGRQVYRTTVGALMDGDRHNVDKARALMAWTDVVATQALGGDACGAPIAAWNDRAAKVADDAEVRFVQTLIQTSCPSAPALVSRPPARREPVAYKIRVDSDVPIAEVALWCEGTESRSALSPSDSVARFQATPGACRVTLEGATPMTAEVQVPAVGGDLRCMVRGGRLACS